MKLYKKLGILCGGSALIMFLLLTGCTRNASMTEEKSVKNTPEVSDKPLTLRVFTYNPISNDEFEHYIVQPVKQKYPNWTLERVTASPGNGLNEWITAGDVPDLIYYQPDITTLLEKDVMLDLNPLIKQYKMDLGRIDPTVMSSIKQIGEKGEIYSLPFSFNTLALFYNKDIFDKFGAAYPQDGMTWEDAIQLAKKVSGTASGNSYRGLEPIPGSIIHFGSPLSLNVYDPKAKKAIISDKWKSVFELAMNIYGIPGNKPEKLPGWTMRNTFVKDQNIAMVSDFVIDMFATIRDSRSDINWDLVQLPSFKEAPNRTFQTDYHQFLISKTSKHPKEAFQVITTALSDEVQRMISRNGRIPVIVNPEIRKDYAADLPFKGKHTDAIFKSQMAPLIQQHLYNSKVTGQLAAAFGQVFSGSADVNTALRIAEEKADAAIQQALIAETSK